MHGHADRSDLAPGDFVQHRPRRRAPEYPGHHHLTGQDRADVGWRATRFDIHVGLDAVELEVVDDADRGAVGIEYLPVQQVQAGVDDSHWPAPVTIISGMAASEAATIITRYMDPNMLSNLPFVLSPMYSGSLATMRMGR